MTAATLDGLFEQAAHAHRHGDLAGAERLCREIVESLADVWRADRFGTIGADRVDDQGVRALREHGLYLVDLLDGVATTANVTSAPIAAQPRREKRFII